MLLFEYLVSLIIIIFYFLLSQLFVSLVIFIVVTPENHVVVGELLELKASQHADMNTPRSMPTDVNWNFDSEASQATGGYSVGFSLSVLQVVYMSSLVAIY